MLSSALPKRAFILGMSRSGISTAEFLLNHGTKVYGWDDAKTPENISLSNSNNFIFCNEINWETLDCLIVSPGITHRHPVPHPLIAKALHHNIPIRSDIDLFCQLFPNFRKIGITGTNGKSTTCALITHALSQNHIPVIMAGNIGIPVFSTVQKSIDPETIYVLELSSYQLCFSNALSLEIAALTNISSHHLERHGTIEEYIQEKLKIFKNASHRLIGGDNPLSQTLIRQCIKFYPSMLCVDSLDTRSHVLYEKHFQQNIQMAQAILSLLKIKNLKISWSNFKGLPHRQEVLSRLKNITYVNDSKATNPESALEALRVFSKHSAVYWIAGGVLQKDSLSVLKMAQSLVKKVFLIGDSAPHFYEFLSSHDIPCVISHTLEKALQNANSEAKKALAEAKCCEATILFSPACASFDQFRDFEHRGETFRQYIQSLSSQGIA